MTDSKALIEALDLAPHPEGGWYRETWRGPDNADGRAVGTAILFLLESHQASHWHKVDAHELWLWQAGDPLLLQLAGPDAVRSQDIMLGPDIAASQSLQGLVPAHHWQAASPAAVAQPIGYSLVSCVVTPGFEFSGFELAAPGWEPSSAR